MIVHQNLGQVSDSIAHVSGSLGGESFYFTCWPSSCSCSSN